MPYPYKSVREWWREAEELGHLIRIRTPIKCGDYNNIVDIGGGLEGKQPETEFRAVVRYLHSLPGKPTGVIEKPINNRPDVPVVVNSWPNRDRALKGMGLKNKDELCERLLNIKANRQKTRILSKGEAPCKEVIIPEKNIDMRKDLPRCWVEFNQVCWTGCNGNIIVYDPDMGTHDIGKMRLGVYEWKDANPDKPFPEEIVKKRGFFTLMYVGVFQSNAGRFYYNKYRKKGQPMPAAIYYGMPTDEHIVAALKTTIKWPKDGDQFELLGGFRGEPVELAESETIPGLKVPAHAEWVVEGEVLPEDEPMPPYSHDIASGYLVGGEHAPIFRIKCITHRKNPWWDGTTFSGSGLASPGMTNGHEGPHGGLNGLFSEPEAINFLRSCGFKIKDVATLAADRIVAVIQLEVDGADKPYPHYGKQVLMAAHGNPGTAGVGPLTKYLIVVGPDINPYDWKDIMWAIGTRTMPISDSIMIEKGLTQWSDPGGFPGAQGWRTFGEQMMIDATIKIPERYESYPPRGEPVEWEKEAIKRMKEKLEAYERLAVAQTAR